MKTIMAIVFSITAILAVIVMAYFSYSFLTLKKREVENQARYQCGQISRYQTIDKSGAIVWYPVKEIYDSCLKEKGY